MPLLTLMHPETLQKLLEFQNNNKEFVSLKNNSKMFQ